MRKSRSIAMILLPCFLASCFLLPGEPHVLSRTLVFVGDVMLGRGVAQALNGDWEAAFAEVQPWLAEADFAFANLESPLTTTPQVNDGYDLRAPLEAVAALRAAGFDVVSLTNNHALDAGEAGLQETVSTLSAAGIAPLVDWEIGELGNWSPMYQSTNIPIYRGLAFDDSAAPLDVAAAAEAVTAAAEQAGVVVVSIHWGGEYQAAPGPRQQAVARALADAGAGVIVGHGPHVLQRVEWVGETLVAYSLGNFAFDQPYPADCRQGAILRLTLRGDRIVAVETIPTVIERGRVVPAGPDDSAAILARLGLVDWEIGKLGNWYRPALANLPIYQPTNLPIYQFTNLPIYRSTMTLFQALLLGVLQGATEFLPISSSGHLVLLPWLLGWPASGLAFDVVVHWGTALAIVAYFWRDWVALVKSTNLKSPNLKSKAWLILLGTLPAALIGYLLKDFFEGMFARPVAAAIFLLLTAAILAASERFGRRQRDLDTLAWPDALIIGLAQALAIFPGISRSGATIAAGLARGLRREPAARFSFLLATPIILGAGLLQTMDLAQAGDLAAQAPTLVVGFLSAGLVGLGCIHFLLRYLQRHRLYPFAVYCAIAGVACLLVALART